MKKRIKALQAENARVRRELQKFNKLRNDYHRQLAKKGKAKSGRDLDGGGAGGGVAGGGGGDDDGGGGGAGGGGMGG